MENPQVTRKRKVNSESWNKNVKKKARHSFEVQTVVQGQPKIACKHSTDFCHADLLTQEDITGSYYYCFVILNQNSQPKL